MCGLPRDGLRDAGRGRRVPVENSCQVGVEPEFTLPLYPHKPDISLVILYRYIIILHIKLTSPRSRLHRAVLTSVSGVLGVLGVARAADLPPFRQ